MEGQESKSEALEPKSEREIAWESKREQVNKIKDKLGLGIDENIKETVTAFQIYEFPTSQSCEGHVESDRGNPYPWVEIYAPEPEGWKESEKKKKEWTEENVKQKQRMAEYLLEFYQGREVPPDVKLTFSSIGIFGGFRVQSIGGEASKELVLGEKQEN